MGKSIVGVDIAASSIRAVEVGDAGRGRPVVLRVAEVPTPEGSVSRGEVLEPNTVGAALRQLWSTGRFRSRDVVLGMGNQRVLSRDLTVPHAPLAQIRESLPFQVQDTLPVPVGDAILDFYPVSEGVDETGPVIRGLLVAAMKEAVLANVRAVRLAGLNAVSVDLIPFALTRVLSPVQAQHGTIAIIQIGADTTSVVLATDGVPQFVRIIPSGGDDITRSLAGRLDIPFAQAEAVKRHFGIGPGARTPDDARAVAAVFDAADELVMSLRNTINYYVNTRPDGGVAGIVLVGGGARLIGLREALADTTHLPVTTPSAFLGAGFGRAVREEDVLAKGDSVAVAYGLAVGCNAA